MCNCTRVILSIFLILWLWLWPWPWPLLIIFALIFLVLVLLVLQPLVLLLLMWLWTWRASKIPMPLQPFRPRLCFFSIPWHILVWPTMQALKVQGRLLKMFPKLCAGCRNRTCWSSSPTRWPRLYYGLRTEVTVLSGRWMMAMATIGRSGAPVILNCTSSFVGWCSQHSAPVVWPLFCSEGFTLRITRNQRVAMPWSTGFKPCWAL